MKLNSTGRLVRTRLEAAKADPACPAGGTLGEIFVRDGGDPDDAFRWVCFIGPYLTLGGKIDRNLNPTFMRLPADQLELVPLADLLERIP